MASSELLGYAYISVRSIFYVYVPNLKLHYKISDSAPTDRANGNAVIVFCVSMTVCQSVKVVKTLIVLKQVVMNIEMMKFPFFRRQAVLHLPFFKIKTWIAVISVLDFEVV